MSTQHNNLNADGKLQCESVSIFEIQPQITTILIIMYLLYYLAISAETCLEKGPLPIYFIGFILCFSGAQIGYYLLKNYYCPKHGFPKVKFT